MVRVVLGTDLPADGTLEVPAVTLGEALSAAREQRAELDGLELTAYVGGVDADRLEGPDTPVGDEDTVLLTRA